MCVPGKLTAVYSQHFISFQSYSTSGLRTQSMWSFVTHLERLREMRSNTKQINKEKIIPSGELGSAPANTALSLWSSSIGHKLNKLPELIRY